jgi:hypothetical protein
MPKQFPIEFRQRALRLLAEARQQQQYETEWAAIQSDGVEAGSEQRDAAEVATALRGRRWHPAGDHQ